jgi:integrase/recombinase XerD
MTLSTSCRQFLQHCRFEKNLSPKTLKAYSADLRQFGLFAGPKVCIDKIGKQEIRAYMARLSGFKPKTIKRKVATLKALFNFMEFEDCILLNPFRKMRIKIREPKRLPIVMDLQEITRIFRATYSQCHTGGNPSGYGYRAAIRNIAVIELLFATGARVSEIANLRTESIQLSNGLLIIRGKGDKERVIQVCNTEAKMALRQYFCLFQDRIEASGGWFFINRAGRKLSDQSIRNLIKRTASQAGLTRKVTPHVFRHSFATLLLERGVDIKYIQSMLGHSSIVTTQLYTHVNAAKQKRILETKHPRRDMGVIR